MLFLLILEDLIAAFIFVLFSSLFFSSTCFSRNVRSFSTVYQLQGFLAHKRDEGGRGKQSRESGELGIQAGVRCNFEFLTGIRARQKVQRYGATKVRFVAERTYRVLFRVSSQKSLNSATPPFASLNSIYFLNVSRMPDGKFTKMSLLNVQNCKISFLCFFPYHPAITAAEINIGIN